MQYTILFKRDENIKDIETREQSRFIKTVLEALEVDIKYNPDKIMSVDERIELRKSLGFYGITIIDNFDGGLRIYVEKELIAEWKKPFYKMKNDSSQIDPKKRLLMEMSVDFWTIFEQKKEGSN